MKLKNFNPLTGAFTAITDDNDIELVTEMGGQIQFKNGISTEHFDYPGRVSGLNGYGLQFKNNDSSMTIQAVQMTQDCEIEMPQTSGTINITP